MSARLRYGYITSGFRDHSLEQIVQVLAHLGYQGVGLTLDHGHLDPFQVSAPRLRRVRRLFEQAGLQPVIETGARYFLDPYRKHRPSLVSVDAEGRARRADFYRRAIEVAAELGAEVVSLWSGTPQGGVAAELCWQRLTAELAPLLECAASAGVRLGFEPEPGMFVESLAHFGELKRRLGAPPALGLTLDLGHLAVTETAPWPDRVREFGADLVNVHVDDCADGVHEHLPLGEGELDFPPLLAALGEVGYRGLALVELGRHSHVAPLQAQRSLVFLRRAERPERS